jgi:hypothetical protein
MDTEDLEYKGFTIFPMPAMGAGERYYGGYEIARNGTTIRARKNLFPGFFYFDAARNDSIEHAKLEIDSLAS